MTADIVFTSTPLDPPPVVDLVHRVPDEDLAEVLDTAVEDLKNWD